MSGEKTGSIGIGIVGGAVVLTASLVGGAAYLLGKGVFGTVRGTANIIGDVNRGRRVRKGLEVSRQQSEHSEKTLEKKLKARDAAYDQSISVLKQEQQNMVKSFSRQSQEQREDYKRRLAELREAQKNYLECRCQGIERDLQQVEKKFNNRMVDMVQQVDKQFSVEKQRVDQLFVKEKQAVARAMESQRNALQSQINHLQAYVENSREAAADWLKMLETEVSFIRDNYRHQFYCPGELDQIESRLNIARNNLAQNIYEVSLSQEAFIQASILRNRLEYMEQEWETNRIMAMQLHDSAIAAYEACSKFQMSQVDFLAENQTTTAATTPDEPFAVETDMWTNGQWAKEHAQLVKNREKISEQKSTISLPELQTLQQHADSAISLAPVLAVKAKCAVIASALRVDMQQQIYTALSKAGYELTGNEWEGNDWRKANHMVLSGANNEKIAIAITPGEEGENTINQIDISFHDMSCNEEERKEKLSVITAAINDAYGLPSDQPLFAVKPGASWTGNAPAERFDLSRLKARI